MRVPTPATTLELLKPITWFPPMWAFACGAVSSGVPWSGHGGSVALGIVLAGPLVCGTSQAVNDWFDRHVDAINEPGRPIPSGRVPGRWGLYIGSIGSVVSLAVASLLGLWVFVATVLALILAWAYSAPPVRLKGNGWWGNLAVGVSYEGLAWVTGAAVMLGGALPDWRILALAGLYSLGAHGIMTLNDFKAIAGDQRMGVRSLPVQLGAGPAAWVASLVMTLPQLVVVVLLLVWGRPGFALVIAALVVIQMAMMWRFLQAPVDRALWYSGSGVPVFVSGMMISAVALRGILG